MLLYGTIFKCTLYRSPGSARLLYRSAQGELFSLASASSKCTGLRMCHIIFFFFKSVPDTGLGMGARARDYAHAIQTSSFY